MEAYRHLGRRAALRVHLHSAKFLVTASSPLSLHAAADTGPCTLVGRACARLASLGPAVSTPRSGIPFSRLAATSCCSIPLCLLSSQRSATAKLKRRRSKAGPFGEKRGERRQLAAVPVTRLYSLAPYPLLLAALLPGTEPVTAVFAPFVELVKTWDLPGWLVHWGHPGNMAVVLFAMGGYGSYLGFRIKLSDDPEEKAKAKDLHPKLLAGMFFFFALGATGGITALLTSDKPIFERSPPDFYQWTRSPHAVTGVIGLALLTIQAILPKLFEENPGLRTTHGLLGSGIMTLFLIHAALGLQLGLSF
ncbi:hypothetical protein PR202_gb18521 [Eleusine coracana subsp. coracana]|uniref:Uncharacterized protein n=1 Tax=Eleusine coracana subsp. coracana TaxID=191504 RepID=A0AAV5F6F5_ELECO|nr:hypothetical protein PR202_gb18521 [Eleusine coracana subsp. coracana]